MSALHARGEGIMLGESWVLTSGSLPYREAGERILSALDVPRPEWPRQPSRTAEDAQGVTGSAGGESPALVSPGAVAAATDAGGGTAGVALIRAERLRQIAAEGYTAEHDARHDGTQLARAAACYALHAAGVRQIGTYPLGQSWPWPWPQADFKPGAAPLNALIKAGALIAAELDRRIAAEAGHD